MSDWDLTEKRIYKLLRHPYQLDKSVAEDMASAYLEFVEELFDYLNRISDNKIRIRQLNMSYIDFGTLKALEESCPTENSKLKLVFLDKLLSLINMEQELIYRQMEYPKFFINIEFVTDRTDIADSCLGRLFHHIPQIPGQSKL